MTQKPALTTDEKNALLGPGTIKRYLKAAGATQVATALINQNSFSYPLAQVTIDATSAGWSNVRPGMTIYVSATAYGLHDKGVFRVRKTPGATTLYIGEMGQGDPGLLPIDIYATLLSDNNFIAILDRYDVWSVLPRIVYPGGGSISEDYDLSVGSNNTSPSPIVNMTINGKSGHFGKFITTATYALTCVVSCTQWVSQTFTYAWSYPASFTGVSGATTATLTATAAPGDYTVSCTVSPNVGNTITVVRHIFICDAANNPPIYLSELPQSDSRDRTGRRMTFSLYNNALASIPDGAMVTYWEEATWNGANVPTASTSFSGWVLKQTRNSAAGLRDATIEVVGPCGVLALLNATSQIITASATADTWQKVVPALSSASFLAWYMLTWRAANLLRLFDFNVFSTSATGQRLPEWRLDRGTLLQQIQQLATERGNFGANSAGSLFFLRHPSLIEYSARTAGVVQRDSLTYGLYKSVSVEERRYKISSQIRGEAFSWDGSATEPTPLLSDAPFVPGQGGAAQKLTQQIVDSQATINQLTGDFLSLVNNPYPSVSVLIQKNRDVYEPAELPFVTVNVPAGSSPDGVAWVKRCIPISVSKQHIDGGAADITLALEAETHGMAGITIAVPVENQQLVTPDIGYPPIDLPIPDLLPPVVPLEPPVITDPGGEPDMETDGSFAFGCTATEVHRSFNFLDTTPTYEDITPSGPTDFQMVLFDPVTDYCRGAYVLANDGTDSTVYYTEDVGATTVIWTAGAVLVGIYTKLAAFKGLPGTVLVSCPASSVVSGTLVTATFDTGGYAYVNEAWSGLTGSIYGNGNPDNCLGYEAAAKSNNSAQATARLQFSVPVTVTEVALDFKKHHTGNIGRDCFLYDAYGNELAHPINLLTTPTDNTWLTDTVSSLSVANVRSVLFHVGASGPAWALNVYMDNCKVTYNASPSGKALVAYSSDYGAHFATIEEVETTPGAIGGFDATRWGAVSLAAADSQVEQATTLGGAYTDRAGAAETALAILIPWWQVGSNSHENTLSPPDALFGGAFGLKTLIGSTAVDITPASGTIAVANALTSWKGRWFGCLTEVSGNRNLYITSDAGANWVLVGGANGCAGALSVRVRRLAGTPGQLVIAAGANGLKYFSGVGTSLVDKAAPAGQHRSWELFG